MLVNKIGSKVNSQVSPKVNPQVSPKIKIQVVEQSTNLLRLLDFSVTKTIVNGKCIYNIVWKNHPIPAHVYKSIAANFRRNDNYAPLSESQLNEIKNTTADINKYNSQYVTCEQLISIRNIVLKEKIIKNYSRMNKDIKEMLTEYERGQGILELSSKYDFAPLNLLRGLLIARGEPKNAIYAIFALKTEPSILLSGRDLEQYNIATDNDAESTFNQQEIARRAAENESRVVSFFKSLGIRIKDQDELVREQIKRHGRAMLTPDILFLDTVYINGLRCHWIDYKDYICTKVNFLYSSNVEQAAKYNAEFGRGALLFRHAYVNGIKIENTQILDCRSLELELN